MKSAFGSIILVCSLSSSFRCFSSAAESTSRSLTAAVIGATGAVGKEVISHLVNRDVWGKVIVINHRHLEYSSSKIEQHVIAMALESVRRECATLTHVDALFITMGGAASKVSEDVFRKVNVVFPTVCSEGAREAGVKHVSILTALGANADAKPGKTFSGTLPNTRAGGGLYNQCKGLVESNIRALKFPWGMSAFRPAALLGLPQTPGIVSMYLETLDKVVPANYKSSHINTVAAAMVYEAEQRAETKDRRDRIFQGETLQAMYCSVPFAHGPPRGEEMSCAQCARVRVCVCACVSVQ